MRDDISYGVRDAEIMDQGSRLFFLELIYYSYQLWQTNHVTGGIFFLAIMIFLNFSRILSFFILAGFAIKTSLIVYQYFIKTQVPDTAYTYTAIAAFFILTIHINTYFYYHE
jgi:hypothetical protein